MNTHNVNAVLLRCDFMLFVPSQVEAVGSDGRCVSASPLRAPPWWSLTSARSRPMRPWGVCRVTSEDKVTWRLWWMCRQKRAWRSWSRVYRCVCVCVCVCGTDRKHTVSITAIMCSVFREIHTFFSVEYTSEPCRAVICPLFSSLLFCSQLISSPSADSLLSASLSVCERSRNHTGRLPAQHGGGPVWQSHPGQPEGTQPWRPVAWSEISELFSHLSVFSSITTLTHW